jgi:hypothetical protein
LSDTLENAYDQNCELSVGKFMRGGAHKELYHGKEEDPEGDENPGEHRVSVLSE